MAFPVTLVIDYSLINRAHRVGSSKIILLELSRCFEIVAAELFSVEISAVCDTCTACVAFDICTTFLSGMEYNMPKDMNRQTCIHAFSN